MTRRGKKKKPKGLHWKLFERERVVYLDGNPMILPDDVEYCQLPRR